MQLLLLNMVAGSDHCHHHGTAGRVAQLQSSLSLLEGNPGLPDTGGDPVKLRLIRQQNGEVAPTRGVGRRRRRAFGLPCVEADVMMIAAGRNEGRLEGWRHAASYSCVSRAEFSSGVGMRNPFGRQWYSTLTIPLIMLPTPPSPQKAATGTPASMEN